MGCHAQPIDITTTEKRLVKHFNVLLLTKLSEITEFMSTQSRLRRAAGAIVYHYNAESSTPSILLICDQYGHWTLPKGHLNPGETEEAAAQREVLEETGVTGELGAFVERISYTVHKKGGSFPKQVAFFLMRTESQHVTPQAEEGISAAEWFAPADALARVSYPQVRSVLAHGLSMLQVVV